MQQNYVGKVCLTTSYSLLSVGVSKHVPKTPHNSVELQLDGQMDVQQPLQCLVLRGGSWKGIGRLLFVAPVPRPKLSPAQTEKKTERQTDRAKKRG